METQTKPDQGLPPTAWPRGGAPEWIHVVEGPISHEDEAPGSGGPDWRGKPNATGKRPIQGCRQEWRTSRTKGSRPGCKSPTNLRIIVCIRSLVDDLHHQLVDSYDVILFFYTGDMVARPNQVRSKTTRAMLTWAYYHLQQFSLHKARERSTCQTCSQCGFSAPMAGPTWTAAATSCSAASRASTRRHHGGRLADTIHHFFPSLRGGNAADGLRQRDAIYRAIRI